MTSYLVCLTLPSARLAGPILATAASFLEARGAVERDALGTFARPRKKDATESVVLVRFGAADVPDPHACARSLEGVLRTTMLAAGIVAGDVRVFAAEA